MMFVFFHLTFPSIIPSRSRWTFVTSGKISSFIMAQYFSIVDPHSIFFIHSLINRHLGYFYTFAIITNATVNTSMQISASSQCFGLFFFFFKGPKYPEVELLDSPGEQNGYLLQYSCLENFTDRDAWQATVHGFAESDTPE